MNKKFNVAIIGCGVISEKHLEAIESMKQVHLKVVCDKKIEQAKLVATTYGCSFTEDYKKLLEDDSIDIIHILTPHYLHVPMAIDCLKAGKRVVLEKPIAINFEQLEELSKTSQRYKKQIAVIMQNRYNPTSIKAKKVVESEAYGKLLSVRAQVAWFRNGSYYDDSDWRGKLAYEGGGLLINQAIHTIDLMQWTCEKFGPVTDIKGHVDNLNHESIEVEDTAYGTMYFKSGILGNFYGTNNNGMNSDIEMEWVFEKAVMKLLNSKLILETEGKETLIILAEDVTGTGEKGYWGKGHQVAITDIYNNFHNEKYPTIGVEEASIAMQLVLGIYASSQIGKSIKLKKE